MAKKRKQSSLSRCVCVYTSRSIYFDLRVSIFSNKKLVDAVLKCVEGV